MNPSVITLREKADCIYPLTLKANYFSSLNPQYCVFPKPKQPKRALLHVGRFCFAKDKYSNLQPACALYCYCNTFVTL